MKKKAANGPLSKKLDDIRRRLLANPTKEELEAMQIQVDVLERIDRMRMRAADDHHHDHMDDHDHTTPKKP